MDIDWEKLILLVAYVITVLQLIVLPRASERALAKFLNIANIKTSNTTGCKHGLALVLAAQVSPGSYL